MSLLREWWGPRFWRILHTMAECSGSMSSMIMANDEADLWTILLKGQAFVMTCALCKEHYLSWYKSHRPIDLRTLKGADRRVYLRRWLLTCHNNVNTQSQKMAFLEENLSETYKKSSLSEPVKDIYEMFRIALERSQLKLEDVNRWKNSVIKLRMLYGV
jgi:Erv1 / Alr family